VITNRPTSGTGLLLLLCNLDPQWHREFRAWLAEDMFPARLAIGFRACASYDRIDADAKPGAARFLTLYDVDSVGELYAAPYQGLRSHRDARDAAFHRRFRDLHRATLTWVGPELARPRAGSDDGAGFAPFVGLTRFAVADERVAAFNAWLVDRYLPRCATLGGVARVRRYLDVEAAPRDRCAHTVLHELTGDEATAAASWADLCADTGWEMVERDPAASDGFRRVLAAGSAI
jgi:hypothetical protein